MVRIKPLENTEFWLMLLGCYYYTFVGGCNVIWSIISTIDTQFNQFPRHIGLVKHKHDFGRRITSRAQIATG
jgi:hypothetical protein